MMGVKNRVLSSTDFLPRVCLVVGVCALRMAGSFLVEVVTRGEESSL